MRRAKVDRNQVEVVKALRQCGFAVAHTHMVGRGFTDIVAARRGHNYLIEIKDGAGQKLTPAQQKFHDEWPGIIRVVSSIDDVLELARVLP